MPSHTSRLESSITWVGMLRSRFSRRMSSDEAAAAAAAAAFGGWWCREKYVYSRCVFPPNTPSSAAMNNNNRNDSSVRFPRGWELEYYVCFSAALLSSTGTFVTRLESCSTEFHRGLGVRGADGLDIGIFHRVEELRLESILLATTLFLNI